MNHCKGWNDDFTVNDEEGLQHVNQEMEAKTAALFGVDRFFSDAF